MVVQKPSIIIYTNQPDLELLREICAGIEEEGVLFQVTQMGEELELDELAFFAANDSMLGAGIGVTGQRIAMQMKSLPKGKNVFELNSPRFWQCRNLGSNSARAVKKMPFKKMFGDELI
ncbi:MAG: glycerol dehydratase [Clostridia bacterium]|nr:glycerol dehydratase [Clostridia bacterium]NCC42300.1 glycerol dehydratase [Clostridia bacterium]